MTPFFEIYIFVANHRFWTKIFDVLSVIFPINSKFGVAIPATKCPPLLKGTHSFLKKLPDHSMWRQRGFWATNFVPVSQESTVVTGL